MYVESNEGRKNQKKFIFISKHAIWYTYNLNTSDQFLMNADVRKESYLFYINLTNVSLDDL